MSGESGGSLSLGVLILESVKDFQRLGSPLDSQILPRRLFLDGTPVQYERAGITFFLCEDAVMLLERKCLIIAEEIKNTGRHLS